MVRIIKATAVVVLTCLIAFGTKAAVYQLPADGSRLIGEPETYRVVQGDYFQQIAEYHNVGMLALIAANPQVDPFLPKEGSRLQLPTQMILPFAARTGIVINLSELRLYYFPPNEKLVYVFPIGIGRQGLSTPKAVSYIGEKRKDPTWYPPLEMRERYLEEKGVTLPAAVPAGENNPLGKFALRIGTSQYLIHGTNQRAGIGLRASSGCIRMYAQDIEWLYYNVRTNTPIRIVDQPIKMSYEESGDKLIEVHEPLSDSSVAELFNMELPAIQTFIGGSSSAKQQIEQLLKKPTGLVSKLKR